MDNATPRSNLVNIVAACIVTAGLISAALIVTYRPVSVLINAGAPSAKTVALPPITQQSAWGQFRAQVLAEPKLNTFLYNGTRYTLSDVKMSPSLTYSAKDDTFSTQYDLVWQPAMPSGGPQGGSAELTNDGYGHYYGSVMLNPNEGDNSHYAYVTIK